MDDKKKYDVLIVVAQKDYNKLNFLFKSIKNLIPQPDNICVVSPTEITNKEENCLYYLDNEVLKIDRGNLKHRPNWVSQQFIKLLQNITPNDNYLVIDSDIFLNKEINVFNNDKPNFFITINQYHQQYFNFLNYFNVHKIYEQSFISEIMMFNKTKIREYLSSINYNTETFLEKSIEIINENCYISEFEFYGNMILSNFPNLYNFTNINTQVFGKHSEWSEDEINSLISSNNNLDIISYHTWT